MVVGKVSEDRKHAIVEHILGMKETLILLGCLIQIGVRTYTRADVVSPSNCERIRVSGLQDISLSLAC